MSIVRTDVRLCGLSHEAILSDRKPFVGKGGPLRAIWEWREKRKSHSVFLERLRKIVLMYAEPFKNGYAVLTRYWHSTVHIWFCRKIFL